MSFITVTEHTAEWCRRAVDECGSMAGVSSHILFHRPKGVLVLDILELEKLTLALRLYKVVTGDPGNFYSIECAIGEIEKKLERFGRVNGTNWNDTNIKEDRKAV